MKALYEAILTRDLDRVAELVRTECRNSGEPDTADSLLRFSVLAFSPSLHSRATMYAAMSIRDLFDRLENRCAVLVECARYAAESRVPWGEAPVTDPPAVPDAFVANDQTIDGAIESEEIHEAERWLASILESEEVAEPFFDAAARHAGKEGYGFCTAVVAWRIAERFPPFARFPALRTALLEWLQPGSIPEPEERRGFQTDVMRAVEAYIDSEGQPDLFQPLIVADSILTAGSFVRTRDRYEGLLQNYVRATEREAKEPGNGGWESRDLVYRYAIDYATFLQSIPLSERLRGIVPAHLCEKIPVVARRFLKSSEGFEEWSFA